MSCKISVAMLTHNESTEFRWLMDALAPALDIVDEIVVVDDYSLPFCQAEELHEVFVSRQAHFLS